MLPREIGGKGRENRFSKAGVVIGRLELKRQEKCKSPLVINAKNTIAIFLPPARYIDLR